MKDEKFINGPYVVLRGKTTPAQSRYSAHGDRTDLVGCTPGELTKIDPPWHSWISVDSRLPTAAEDTVLVADKFGNVGFGCLFPDGVWDCSIEIVDGDCPGYVTHWMPLPPPPMTPLSFPHAHL